MGWMTHKRGPVFWAVLPFMVVGATVWVFSKAVYEKVTRRRDETPKET